MCCIENFIINTFFVAWIFVMGNPNVTSFAIHINSVWPHHEFKHSRKFPLHAFSLFCPTLVPICRQITSRHRADNMKTYVWLLIMGWSDCCKAGGGVNFDVTTLLTICIYIGIILLFKQAGFHIASGNKDLSDMLNNNKESDSAAVYHSWINSILESILHELDEKFEVAEEDRESTNFWIICMGVLGLILFIGLTVSFGVMITRLSRRQKGPSDLEMNEFGRDRRASRAEDINVNFKREP